MSLKTWKEEFYPKNPTKKMSKVEAIEHSLLKWEGLRKKNLSKHKVEIVSYNFITDYENGVIFKVNDETCALCKKYYNYDDLGNCLKCPLFSIIGNEQCDHSGKPYNTFIEYGNPIPMINALKKVLKVEIGT